jgi:hypothetical protein
VGGRAGRSAKVVSFLCVALLRSGCLCVLFCALRERSCYQSENGMSVGESPLTTPFWSSIYPTLICGESPKLG